MNRTAAKLIDRFGISHQSALEIVRDHMADDPHAEKLAIRRVMPVEVYSRVCGFFRPVHQWNRGKQEEFKERKTYRFKANIGC